MRVTRDSNVFASRCAGVYFSPVRSLSFLIRGGRVWEVLINSPAGPSGKSVSFSQRENARQEGQFPFLLPGGQQSHFPVTFLVSYFLLCCPSLSSVLLYLHLLSLSPFSVIWRIGGTSEKYLMHSRWNTVMTVLDTFCAHHGFALQLQLAKQSLATAACSGSRHCLWWHIAVDKTQSHELQDGPLVSSALMSCPRLVRLEMDLWDCVRNTIDTRAQAQGMDPLRCTSRMAGAKRTHHVQLLGKALLQSQDRRRVTRRDALLSGVLWAVMMTTSA